MQTYRDFKLEPDDTREERLRKLYLGICSAGEQLYSAGSALAEMNKKLLAFEKTIEDMRREFEALKQVKEWAKQYQQTLQEA